MAVWQIDALQAVAPSKSLLMMQTPELACSEFVRLWKAQPDQNFGLFEMDIWRQQMQLTPDVLELRQLYNAQYAGAYAGDPETTYDKILQQQ